MRWLFVIVLSACALPAAYGTGENTSKSMNRNQLKLMKEDKTL